MRYGFVVCSHGLGHLVRSLRVAGELLTQGSDCLVDVWCGERGVDRLRDSELLEWANRDGLRLCTLNDRDLLPRFMQPDTTDVSPLSHLDLGGPDLIVSDNLVEVLTHRDDAVLSGSFLWHEVGDGNGPLSEQSDRFRAYSRWARELLAESVPPMVCNQYFAMPAVVKCPHPVKVGMLRPIWTEKGREVPRDQVLIHAGSASDAFRVKVADEFVPRVAEECGDEIDIVADAWFCQQSKTGVDVNPFGYDSEFLRLRVCVGRPGMGLIADCVGARIPLVAIYENGHPEMAHNARVLEELGIGIDAASDLRLAVDAAARLVVKGPPDRGFRSFDLDGARETVDFLTRYYKKTVDQ